MSEGAGPSDRVLFRPARAEDVSAIVRLLADDAVSGAREDLREPLADAYHLAFQEIAAEPRCELVVAELGGEIVGTLQLTIIPGLAQQGLRRAELEGVRVARRWRGRGIGRVMLSYAIARARERGCRLIQLTSNRVRTDAIRLYGSLGFESNHLGMKLYLD